MENCVRNKNKQREYCSFRMSIEFFVKNDITVAVSNGSDGSSNQIQNCFYRLVCLGPVDRIKVIHVERFCLRQQNISVVKYLGVHLPRNIRAEGEIGEDIWVQCKVFPFPV